MSQRTNERSTVKIRPKPLSGAGFKAPKRARGWVEIYLHGGVGMGKIVKCEPANVIGSIQAGLPFRELDTLRDTLDLPEQTLAAKLGISKATLQRRKAQRRLRPHESDRVLRFARLAGMAIEAMETVENARRWLNSPQTGLGGAIPLDYAQTEIGAREVENLLGRIEFGVYS